MTLTEEQLNGLLRYAFSLTKNRDDAYDLLQTSIEKLLRSSERNTAKVAYVRRIIRNQFIDDCRRNKVIDFEPVDEEQLSLFSADTLEKTHIDRDMVDTLMAHYNASERETLYLWAVQGMTAQEIADETGQKRNAVLTRLFRIREKAKKFTEYPDNAKNVGGAS